MRCSRSVLRRRRDRSMCAGIRDRYHGLRHGRPHDAGRNQLDQMHSERHDRRDVRSTAVGRRPNMRRPDRSSMATALRASCATSNQKARHGARPRAVPAQTPAPMNVFKRWDRVDCLYRATWKSSPLGSRSTREMEPTFTSQSSVALQDSAIGTRTGVEGWRARIAPKPVVDASVDRRATRRGVTRGPAKSSTRTASFPRAEATATRTPPLAPPPQSHHRSALYLPNRA